jgi:ADP-ribosyl-[dinitrogen reductase] hydrolase
MATKETPSIKKNRWLGSIVGLAIGDQLGSLSEMKPPGSFEPVKGMVEGTLWTDDTSQALCIADSLISLKKIDLTDQLQRFDEWLSTGYLSCVGWGYGCGPTVRIAIVNFRETGVPSPVTNEPTNGSLMRLAPVPLFYSNDMDMAIEMSGKSSLTTHDHPLCIDACRLYGSMIVKAVNGKSKSEILEYDADLWKDNPLVGPIDEIARGSYKDKTPPPVTGTTFGTEVPEGIRGTLNVVESIEASIWVFHNTGSFPAGALQAVNLGDDTDTTAAIFGQLGGAYYGYDQIPEPWKAKLLDRTLVEYIAKKLYEEHL